MNMSLLRAKASWMRVQLVPLDGGRTIDLVNDLTLVGRQDDCDLQLNHKSVSKMHCVLVKADGMLFLRDLGSTNGTRVNGQRVRRAALMSEDQITIAGYGYRVVVEKNGVAPRPQSVPFECTINVNAKEAPRPAQASARYAAPQAPRANEDDSVALGGAILNNALPDVYPEDRR